jgi:hypothetical protein|tara:strand:+ start:251 stop:1030 length:780 start_codon:yes stop_codon:yes gene_type:complete
MSELEYKDNYLSLIQALQVGGTAGIEALRSSNESRGLGRRLDGNRYVSDEEVEESSLSKRLLSKMDNTQKENKSMLEQLKDMDIEQDPVTGNLEETATFSKSSGVTIDKAYDTSFKLIDDLKSQFGMTTEQAAGFVGNLWHETGGFKFMQELKPTIKGSRGGLAFAQWTGDRRDDFENLLKELGDLPAESYEGNWAMISEEFDTTEKSALNKILNTDSVVEAAKATSNHYLRPGKPQLNKRVSAAEDIYKRYNEDRSLK